MAKTNKSKEKEVTSKVEETVAEETVAESTETFTDNSNEKDYHKVGVYVNNALYKEFNSVNHGLEFEQLANAYAQRHADKNPGSRVEVRPLIDITEETPERDVVKILNASNSLVRVFSKATHGDEYRDLANAFVAKYGEKRGLKAVE